VPAPAAAHVLQAVGHAPAGQPAQPFERQRGPCAVANKAFASHVVSAFDPHARVQVGMTAGTGAANSSGAGTTGGPVGDMGMAAGPAVMCAAVQASSYNQACAVDSDCTLTGGKVTGCQCCPYGAINVTARPAYDANLAVALAPFDAGFATCTCGAGPAPPSPCCAKGICQVGTSCAGATIVPDIDASDEDVAALADGDVSDAATGCLAAGGQCGIRCSPRRGRRCWRLGA
jgi:hypothetical protein